MNDNEPQPFAVDVEASIDELERRVCDLRRRAKDASEEWSRVMSQRSKAGVAAVLAALYSLTGFLFRMDQPEFTDAVFIYASVPVAIGGGIWWLAGRAKERELRKQTMKIEHDLSRAEEAYYDPNI
jgi:hypothetical protein